MARCMGTALFLYPARAHFHTKEPAKYAAKMQLFQSRKHAPRQAAAAGQVCAAGRSQVKVVSLADFRKDVGEEKHDAIVACVARPAGSSSVDDMLAAVGSLPGHDARSFLRLFRFKTGVDGATKVGRCGSEGVRGNVGFHVICRRAAPLPARVGANKSRS